MLTNSSIGISGLVVLGGHTSVKEPKANFRNAFDGSGAASVYGTTNALVKVMFSYAGYENAFNVVNEVRVRVDASVIIMVSLLTYQ
jgi:amino acid transporter